MKKYSIYNLRKSLEDFVKESLNANCHAAGTDLITGEVDFSFDLNDCNYSVHIKELNR